ncbi:hypothetical protein QYE76_060327 [Lolium multiflorum]|uniref:Retrotransposon gag domain-containing protein n=1 Tax=Lolium multiflorum TaxID=4521 RepID=A0AAD8S1Y9_LOLMU|nr:hypothetical protein QYE76_060327 [Lolium multiflorum]
MRRRGAAGQEDGREAGHGAGHEDIPRTRERSGRNAREGKMQLRPVPGPVKPAVPPGHPVPAPKDKDAADLMTWRDYEALRNEMRREFRSQDDELRGSVQEISQKLDPINETVTTMTDQMKDIQHSLQALQLAVDNLTQQQQQEDEDPEIQDDRGVGRGNRGHGFVELGARRVPPQQHDDGLGKPKFSIPKFEGGDDVEEYLTWELKIQKLWRLHDYTEDRKVKLASSEFDGYALCWWDGVTRAHQEDNELPVLTWREMKAIMQARFVPTNYLRTIYDKLTLLRQGVKIVDVYFMEMEMLMRRGRVLTPLEKLKHSWLEKLKSKVVLRELGATRLGRPHLRRQRAHYSTPSSKPVSNVSNTKKSETAASTSGSSMSTARNRDMNCHTCGGKGHFKRDYPNRKVMIINEDNEYETGDDVDPNAPEDDDYDSDGVDAFPSEARTIVSQRALNVQPSASTQRYNLFQTKALVGPDKACKVIIDGGSCRNLASKELCAKLKLKYLPHPHPYYIQWLSDNGEMKVNHMVRVEFAIGPTAVCFELINEKEESSQVSSIVSGNKSGYMEKLPFKPLPPKGGNEEKKKKRGKKKKEVMAYPRVYEITIGNRKYVAPNDYYDNESEYNDLPMPFTYISDHDLEGHTTFDTENLFGTDYESNDVSTIHVLSNDDIESSKLGDVVLEDPIFETFTFSENDDIISSGLDNRHRDGYDTGFSLQSSPKNKEEDDPRSGANPISSDKEKKEKRAERTEASPSTKLPPKKRSRMWADSEDDDDDEEEEDEEEEDDSSSAGYPPTKRLRTWADSEDDDDDEEEEEAPADSWDSDGEELPGSSADDLDDGDDEDGDD